MPEDPVTDPAHDRHIELDGAVNFRDLGGYPAADGRQVRWRTLFRADGLSNLSDRDRGIVRQLGVATVIDLRTPVELERGRFPVEDIPVDFRNLPLLSTIPDPTRFEIVPGLLATSYQEMAREASDQIATVLTLLAHQASHPVIIHCTAGKDRTGVMVAVLLGLLGVPDAIVVTDYALSARAMDRLRQKLVATHPEAKDVINAADAMFSAAPENMASLLAALRSEYGTIEAYAESAGAGPDVVKGLREHLLV
jgi:protein tyrosine/serine phosphatase